MLLRSIVWSLIRAASGKRKEPFPHPDYLQHLLLVILYQGKRGLFAPLLAVVNTHLLFLFMWRVRNFKKVFWVPWSGRVWKVKLTEFGQNWQNWVACFKSIMVILSKAFTTPIVCRIIFSIKSRIFGDSGICRCDPFPPTIKRKVSVALPDGPRGRDQFGGRRPPTFLSHKHVSDHRFSVGGAE